MLELATQRIVDGFLRAIAAAWSYRQAGRAAAADEAAVLQQVQEHSLRLIGSLLFEARSNIEFLRYLDKRGDMYRPLDFSVSDALLPELCRVAPSPSVLEACRAVLEDLRYVDFFQRAGGGAIVTPGSADAKHRVALGFAQDALSRKRLVDRFNALVAFGNKLAAALYDTAEWETGGSLLLPAPIDPAQEPAV